jgi:hypothetical protein
MRNLFIALTIVFFAVGNMYSQDQQGAFIAFDRELHEYGEISSDSLPDGKIRFAVYNKGTQPLVLSNVRACCGTTVNDYTKQPIPPEGSGFIEVQFRIVPQPHRIRRTVTIQSNASNRQTAILRIQGEVVEARGDLTLQKRQD